MSRERSFVVAGRRTRARAWVLALAVGGAVAGGGAVGCGEGGELREAPVVAAPAVVPDPERGDALLARARDSMRGGKLDPELEREILESGAPEHARARRLLRHMANEGRPKGAAGSEEPTRKKPASSGSDAPASPTISVVAPPKDSAPNSASTANSGPKPDAGTQAPALAMLTRLRLSGGNDKVTLKLNAADRVVMGIAEQPQSGLVRLVVESAGALPAFLQARPQLAGVKVVDVRRGEDTVQISVELTPGWKARGPRSGASGASVEFVRIAD